MTLKLGRLLIASNNAIYGRLFWKIFINTQKQNFLTKETNTTTCTHTRARARAHTHTQPH